MAKNITALNRGNEYIASMTKPIKAQTMINANSSKYESTHAITTPFKRLFITTP